MAFAVVLSLAACGSGNGREGSSRCTEQETTLQASGNKDGTEEEADGSKPASETQESKETEASSDIRQSEQPESSEEPASEETAGTGAKALVVYFSATGNTRAVAETLAGLQGAAGFCEAG